MSSNPDISAADREMQELQQRMAQLKREKEQLEAERANSPEERQPAKRPASKRPNSQATAAPPQAPVAAPAERDGAAEEPQEEPQEEFASSGGFMALIAGSPPWLISSVVHLIAIILLALMSFSIALDKDKLWVEADAIEDDETEQLEELSEVEMEQLEELEVQEMAIPTNAPDPGQISFGEIASAADATVSELGQVAMADTTIGEIGALFGDEGDGFADVGDGLKAAASFFGTKSQGNRFVFICDNSNSMGRGKFETTLDELMKSVNSMSEKQFFYVIFFSDTAYGLFHPQTSPNMVRATPENKEKLRAWLYTVEMCLRTKGEAAATAALNFNPDVIYILGDGNFTDKTGQMLTAPHNRRTVINTFGMRVNAAGEKELSAIAAANNGVFKRVDVSPAAVAMAKQNPIKKNNKRGPVWGIDLPR